jgi:hypothetical protein
MTSCDHDGPCYNMSNRHRTTCFAPADPMSFVSTEIAETCGDFRKNHGCGLVEGTRRANFLAFSCFRIVAFLSVFAGLVRGISRRASLLGSPRATIFDHYQDPLPGWFSNAGTLRLSVGKWCVVATCSFRVCRYKPPNVHLVLKNACFRGYPALDVGPPQRR